MKSAVIIYHKYVGSYIPREWAMQCIDSIRAQTYKGFDVLEMNYGGDESLYKGSNFFYGEQPNHAHAQNTLLNYAFLLGGYDCAFNVNIDDYYAPERFERQIAAIEQGHDLVSCNMVHIRDGRQTFVSRFHEKNLRVELSRDRNIIVHPGVCYSRKFWLECGGYNPDEIPCEDMRLWQRSLKKGLKFFILPDVLVYYRIHDNNVSKERRRK